MPPGNQSKKLEVHFTKPEKKVYLNPWTPISPRYPFSPIIPISPNIPFSPLGPKGPSNPISPGTPSGPRIPGKPGCPCKPLSPLHWHLWDWVHPLHAAWGYENILRLNLILINSRGHSRFFWFSSTLNQPKYLPKIMIWAKFFFFKCFSILK